MTDYSRGSEWRRWDLHVHTASSYDYGYKAPDSDNVLVDTLNKNEISAVAITDHFVIDKARIEKLRQLAPAIVFFPGVELRTDKGDTNIHIILIFSNLISLDILTESFNVFKREKGKEEQDNNRIYWDYNDILEFATRHDALISIHAGSKTNGVDEKISNALPHNQAVKEEIAKYIHIFEMGKPKDLDEYRKNVFPSTGPKPMIICSDNHDSREYSLKEKLWIKSDVTFAGLRQIVYEPTERVCVSATKPELRPGYFVIDRIEIADVDFQEEPIHLNERLNCIIGGKSTGKSILLHNLALSLDKGQVVEKDKISQTRTKKDLSLVVHWADGKSNLEYPPAERKIVYIPQTYLNKLCDTETEKTEIDNIIQDVVLKRAHNVKTTFETVATNVKTAQKDYSILVIELIATHKEIGEITAQIREIGDKEGIITEQVKLNREKERLTSESTLTSEEVTNYENATNRISTLTTEIDSIDREIMAINAISTLVEAKQLGYAFSEFVKSEIVGIRDNIILIADAEWQKGKDNILSALIASKETKAKALSDALQVEESLKPKIASNKEITTLAEMVKIEADKLASIITLETERSEKEKSLLAMLDEIIGSMAKFEAFHKEFADIVNGNADITTRDLEFSVDVPFRRMSFLAKLTEIYPNNNTTYKSLIKPDAPDYERHSNSVLKEIVTKTLSGEFPLKTNNTIQSALSEIFSDWYEVKYKVVMGNDSIDVMSPGKKALVLLKLLIELADSECPILIDQPEDDLDNRSIFDELIEFIKIKKKERQIIIVTHNANIVVGADSEEIIIANQRGNNTPNEIKRFEYRSGSIENDVSVFDQKTGTAKSGILNSQGIQQHICDILEGGEIAFSIRKAKYHI